MDGYYEWHGLWFRVYAGHFSIYLLYNYIKCPQLEFGDYLFKRQDTHYDIETCVCTLANAVLNQAPTNYFGLLFVARRARRIGCIAFSSICDERWSPEEYRAFFDAVESVRRVLNKLD